MYGFAYHYLNSSESAADVTLIIQQASDVDGKGKILDNKLLANAMYNLTRRFDRTWGGFGDAPKFPQPMVIEFLLREYVRSGDANALDMAELTLQKMAYGGI